MQVSTSWLEEYVTLTLDPQELGDALTMAGLEVEALWNRFDYLDSVLVGKIVAIAPHPNAQRLNLCRVDLGDRMVNVVCGAPNATVGILAACALPGTVMPDGSVLQAGAIRGETSEAMLCSDGELGLGSDRSGIKVLAGEPPPGTPINKALGLADMVYEIGLTPNRSDCLSIIGIAREVAAIQGTPLRHPDLRLPKGSDRIDALTSIEILAPDACPRYTASLLLDVTVAPSPHWLQDRLLSVGLKPINNIVDITNFVMMETGQPLHAFDFDQLEEHRIVVKTAKEGEKFTTLDGKERTLSGDTLMICDGRKAVAVGGVMGGQNSEISAATRRVLIESACFDPVSIRKTAKRFGLSTDASHRFERGVDPEGTLTALQRATQLTAELGRARRVSGLLDDHPRPAQRRVLDVTADDINRRLGTQLDADAMQRYLTAVDFDTASSGDGRFQVTVPSFRVDVSRWEDLSEEIARLHGYDRIATTYPKIPAEGRRADAERRNRDRMRSQMAALGFAEAITYSFIHRASGDRLRLAPDDRCRRFVEILNPLTDDQSVLRTSLIPGLLEAMKRNLDAQVRDLRLFEMGRVFFNAETADQQPEEIEMLAFLWTGDRYRSQWSTKEAACDFFDLKGAAESLLASLDITGVCFSALAPVDGPFLRPGHAARITLDETRIGRMGELHPLVQQAYGLRQTAFLCEMSVPALLAHIPGETTAQPIARYPAVSRDITLILDAAQETGAITRFVDNLDEPLLERSHLFDVYAGDPIPDGKKSVSFRLTYRSDQGTLEDATVNQIHTRVSEAVVLAFKAGLPGT
jgi:phenylalanyl-tRNA synthetase beta chain